jgi:hypothetical protein
VTDQPAVNVHATLVGLLRVAHTPAQAEHAAKEVLAMHARQLDNHHAATAAVRDWLPVLRRAIGCLPTACRYHGEQLDPDQFGRMTRSEACCETGIKPRRAREARAALAALTAPDGTEQPTTTKEN